MFIDKWGKNRSLCGLSCGFALDFVACLHPSIVAQAGLRGFMEVVFLLLADLHIHLRSFALGQ